MREAADLSQIKLVGFDWDKGNREKNWLKHHVETNECEEIFYNEPLLLFKDFAHSQKEERFLAYGVTDKRRLLTVVFTVRKDLIRIISGRNQNKKERREYEKAQINTAI